MGQGLCIPDEAWIPLGAREFAERRARLDDWLGADWADETDRVALEPYQGMLFDLVQHLGGHEGSALRERRFAEPYATQQTGEGVRRAVLPLCSDRDRRFLVSIDEVGVFHLTWHEYVRAFEEGIPMLLAVGVSEDLGMVFVSYYGEYFFAGEPSKGRIGRIVRIAKWRTQQGDLVSKERLGVGYTDGTFWESGRFDHGVPRDRMEALERALAWATGLPVERCELSPWVEGQGLQGRGG